MARIEGVNLPDKKWVLYGLPYIYGIGPSNALLILDVCGIPHNKRVKDLTEQEVSMIGKEIAANYVVEGELRKQVLLNIQGLQAIGCYRGIRHKMGLPVRGQRTHTNARTRKGPRKAGGAIAAKKKVTKK